MNYYQARELVKDGKSTGLWHYTVMNDSYVMAIGYCSPWDSCPNCFNEGACQFGWLRNSEGELLKDEKGNFIKCEKCGGKGLVEKESPCPGHSTKEEACEHYKQYLVDRAEIRGPEIQSWPKDKCGFEGCDNEATHYAAVRGMEYHRMCPEHATKEVLAKLVRVGTCISSY